MARKCRSAAARALAWIIALEYYPLRDKDCRSPSKQENRIISKQMPKHGSAECIHTLASTCEFGFRSLEPAEAGVASKYPLIPLLYHLSIELVFSIPEQCRVDYILGLPFFLHNFPLDRRCVMDLLQVISAPGPRQSNTNRHMARIVAARQKEMSIVSLVRSVPRLVRSKRN